MEKFRSSTACLTRFIKRGAIRNATNHFTFGTVLTEWRYVAVPTVSEQTRVSRMMFTASILPRILQIVPFVQFWVVALQNVELPGDGGHGLTMS